ncbi:MAG: hypothetical protein ACD_21C00016G0009 [uncultured bacterium]|nr:MAG: hypothetical protein ACD_21C00016G0009 [uncultured bacterium]
MMGFQKRCKYFFLWVFLFYTCIVHGATALDLPTLVNEALQNNPEINAALEHWHAAKAMISQARTLPDPSINFGYKKMSGSDMHSHERMYGFSQEIPFPNKLYLRGQVASSEAESIKQNYFATRRQVIAQLKEIYYELYLVTRSIGILEYNKSLLVSIEKTAKAYYAVGKGSQQDVFRAQTEITRLISRLLMLKQERESLQAEINRIINRPSMAPIQVLLTLPHRPLHHSLVELNARLAYSSPHLLTRLKNVERNDRSVALAKSEYLPDFEIEFERFRKNENSVRENGYEAKLKATIPLYFMTKQNQGVKEAAANRAASFQDFKNIRTDLLFRIKDSVLKIERANELINLIKNTLIPQARFTFDSAKASYSVGKVDFLTLLNSFLTLQENEIELRSEQVAYEKAMARLEEIVGDEP